jgi:hypothetical protein
MFFSKYSKLNFCFRAILLTVWSVSLIGARGILAGEFMGGIQKRPNPRCPLIEGMFSLS